MATAETKATTAAAAKRKQIKFSDPAKQKVYDHLLKYPGSNFTSYQIKSNDPALSESEFNEVLRAMRVSEDLDESESPAGGAEKKSKSNASASGDESSKPNVTAAKAAGEKNMQSESTMEKSSAGEVKPKGKRGRPPGSKKTAAANTGKTMKTFKPGKELQSRASFPGKSAASGKTAAGKKGSGQGRRYSPELQKEIVTFITEQGRGGLTQAQKKFGVSYPTLIRWVNEAGPAARAASKKSAEKSGSSAGNVALGGAVKTPGKRGRPRKSDSLGATPATPVKVPGKRGRPRKTDVASVALKRKPGRPPKLGAAKSGAETSGAKNSGHVLISKKVLQEFRKGLANLEAAFGAFSNAIRVLE